MTGVVESMEGTAFSINGRGAFRLPLLGEHNAVNALMAIAVARRLGLSDEQIAAGLLKVTAAEMRLERTRRHLAGHQRCVQCESEFDGGRPENFRPAYA